MGNRRMGAQRLNALLRRGSTGTDTSYQAGAGISGAVKSHRMIKDGVFVITEIVLDLGTSETDIRSSSLDRPIGTHGSSASAELMLWEDDIHGVLQSTETYVAEALTTVTACSLAVGTNQAAIDVAITGRADINAGFATSAKRVGAAVVQATSPDGKYVYITGDDNANTTLNAGQLVIRLIGMKSSDISVD
tara:strand:- start:3358 stop:3930 length:573 start_codon:yes stop_codon:yes gene_type:complete